MDVIQTDNFGYMGAYLNELQIYTTPVSFEAISCPLHFLVTG